MGHRNGVMGVLVGVVGVGALVLCGLDGPRAAVARGVAPRELTLTYLATIAELPRDARDVHVWVPLATSRDGQEVVRYIVRSPASYTIGQDPAYHNGILYFTTGGQVDTPLVIQVDYELTLGRTPEELPPSPMELQQELRAQGLLIIDDEVRARAHEAAVGRATPVDQARGIYDYVIRHMRYEKTTPGWGRGDTRRACQLLRGNCTDFHSLFISMARAQRIPARFKIGLVVPEEPSGTIAGYHCWAEFYVEGRGWVPVDASEAWKHPERADDYFGAQAPNRVLISVGRDIELVPPQERGPVNIFFFPYVEVDGQPFAEVKTEFRFQSRVAPDIGVPGAATEEGT